MSRDLFSIFRGFFMVWETPTKLNPLIIVKYYFWRRSFWSTEWKILALHKIQDLFTWINNLKKFVSQDLFFLVSQSSYEINISKLQSLARRLSELWKSSWFGWENLEPAVASNRNLFSWRILLLACSVKVKDMIYVKR